MSGDIRLEQERIRPALGVNDLTGQTAASWYVAMRSDALKDKPVAIKLFGQPLVAWRNASGQPVVMERYCSHLGASLAKGKVVEGCIQCPFHNWRYDSTGACSHVPGHSTAVPRLEPIPPTARQAVYPTTERYGFVWVWYGTQVPLFPVPEMAEAESPRDFMRLSFAYETRTSVLRIIENFYDAQHAAPVHQLPITAFELKLDDESNPPPGQEGLAREGAWFGAGIDFHVERYFGPVGIVSRALGLNMSRMNLHFDGYPGGCIMTVSLDGDMKYRLLQCVTPVDKDETVMHMLLAIKKGSGVARSAANFVLFGLQTWGAAGYDVAIWNNMKSDAGGAFSKYDQLILKYRAFYRRWVNKVAQEQPSPMRDSRADPRRSAHG
ncbi:2Fe-2S ferredoxin [Corallococcus sp. H22C18031201]|uniref:Rieske 2Fe-2S domain-containing protein n=1 Tax=Citreicoccus inhibens TaxID=2849499 RepID=UPI000E7075D5|nr:Rieske 2Fe-2S domain-containing protein [Citreicoccus inhibens]MBU8900885.1 Rieske 2Fe-2S domain-containing protein [Citreicoccus inhibens]RJS21750.1 2Fe-2S ferredoxin [Corallococcus sp. H22C18031201]